MIIHAFTIELRTLDPVSIAAPERARMKSGADLPVAQDAWGQPYIPTSSVVGSLRAHARTKLRDAGQQLLGSDFGQVKKPRPSKLRFLGTEMRTKAQVQTAPQTAVSRRTGAAADRAYRQRESLPSGTEFTVFCTAEDLTADELDDVRDVLVSWQPVLGGARTTGLGRTRVHSVGVRAFDCSTIEGLTDWLSTQGRFDTADTTWAGQEPAKSPKPTYTFSVASDLFVGSGVKEGPVAQPFRRGQDLVIPGSAWKGIFRSRAEFILRSLGLPACASTDSGTCGTCVPCVLFGNSPKATDQGPTGYRGRLTFHETHIENAQTAKRTHVGIDRFTGGANRGQLFTQEVVTHGTVKLAIDIADGFDWAKPLLDWVAWDIHEGFMGVGHGTTRGMGWLELDDEDAASVQARLGNLEEALVASGGSA